MQGGLLYANLYANKGFRFDYPGSSKSNLYLHYLTFPVLLNYRISRKLHGGVGGTLGYRLAARSKSKDRNVNVSWIYDNKTDVGINLSVKYEISNKINLGIRYTHGLSNIYEERGVISDSDGYPIDKFPKYQNRELQLSGGYVIGSVIF